MNNNLIKNHKLMISLSVFLLLALAATIYLYVLYPKMEKVKLKEMELQTQEQLLSTLQNKVTDTNNNTSENTVILQKKIPVKPLTQQLLLDIEKAEVMSGSFVAKMTFQDGEVLELNDGDSVGNENINRDTEPDGIELDKRSDIPTGVEKVSVDLTVESQNYFELETFLKSLESQERIIVVEEIDFTVNDEIIEESQEITPLTYQVILSVFYMPSLSDLIEQLPKIETPKPANKKNPLSSFGDYSNEEGEITDLEGASGIVDDRENTKINYEVKQGDTIYQLALEYYHSIEGVEKIKKANNLKNNKIITGQVLIIPLSENE